MPPKRCKLCCTRRRSGDIERKAGTYYEKATVSFMTQKMNVEFDEGADVKATMQNVLSACKKVEDDCEIFGI